MDFSYSDEQQMLRSSIAKFVSQDYDFDARRRIVASETGYSEKNWTLFAQLGWLMIPFSQHDGGLGNSAVDLCIVMEEFGKGIVVEPFLANAVLAGGLVAAVASDTQKQALLGPLMEGNLQLAFAFNEPQSRYNLADIKTCAEFQSGNFVVNGHKAVVFNGGVADKLVVAVRTSGEQRDDDGISLLLIDRRAGGISCHRYPTVDGHRAAEIYFENVVVPETDLLGEINVALPEISKVIDRAILAVCAEAVGAMEVTYKKTVEYTQIRQQFGVPIARFQALQHRMVNMFMECELARSILLMAAMKMDSSAASGDLEKAVSAAKNRIGKAARLIGQEAVQLHGGVGVTEELDIGHYFKRLTTIQFMFGSGDYHTQRYLVN